MPAKPRGWSFCATGCHPFLASSPWRNFSPKRVSGSSTRAIAEHGKAPDDILDIVGDLPKEIEDIAFGRRFRLSPDQIFVIGGSFGRAAAILASLNPRVTRVIANCPIVDWKILDRSEKVETSNESYAEYIQEAFGNGYRLSDANWEKLRSGSFYNPWHKRTEIIASKVMMFHAKDDPHVPYEGSKQFAELTGVKLKTLKRGGHISTDYIIRRNWTEIKKFFDSDHE